MDQSEVTRVVQTTLAVMQRIAKCTRTPADDLMVAILKANQDRLAKAVLELLGDERQPPSSERVAEVLAKVGIKV